MTKIKDYIKAHETQVLLVLGALISFFTALATLGGKEAVVCTIIVAFIELLICYIKNGMSEEFLNLSVKTIQMIVDIENGKYTKEVNTVQDVKMASGEIRQRNKKVKVCMLTEEDIRQHLKK